MMSAAEVGEAVQRTGRMVKRWHAANDSWAADPCPHDRVRVGKIETYRYNLDEVRAWMRRSGMEPPPAVESTRPMFDLVTGAPVITAPPAASAQPAAAASVAPDPLAGLPVGGAGGAGAELALFRASLRDFLRYLAGFRAMVEKGDLGSFSADQMAKMVKAAKDASQEGRMLDEAEREAKVRRGQLVEAGPVRIAWGSLCGDFVSALTRLEVELGGSIKRDLAEHGCLSPEAAGEGEKVERIVRAAVRIASDRERSRLEKELRTAAAAEREAA